MDNKKKIEIPLRAFDSELIHQEINIPNGFNAVIEGNKIILTKIESEDEKVRKALVEMVHDTPNSECEQNYNVRKEDCLAWIEKQGEQKPTWSEEDELVVEDIEEAVINYWHGQSQEDLLDWLKALKQRIGG